MNVLSWCTAVLKDMEMLELVEEGPKYLVCYSPRG